MTDWRVRSSEAGWVLLPLRGFLGFVYVYAGVSKIADRRFFDHSSPRSMYASILAVRDTSPIGGLLGPVEHHTTLFGTSMAIGELAVGLGVLVGLFTRVAAVGGMLIALSLWLTVSWGAEPWFTSADLVYLFAFTPLLVAGAGTVLSADAWLAATRVDHPDDDRVRRVLVTGGLATLGAVLLGVAGLARESAPKRRLTGRGATATPTPSGSTTPPAGSATPSTSSSAPPGPVLAAASAIPVGGAVQVSDPLTGGPVYVLQLQPGQFTAVSAICTHEGCTVDFVNAQLGFRCPCHRSQFTATGDVIQGPAASPLGQIQVQVDGGQVRATT